MMDPVDAAVVRFRRCIGASVVFDADDARQEAALRVWLAGGNGAAAYRGVIDALRKLVPGWRQRRTMRSVEFSDDHDAQSLDTPELILLAKQEAIRLEAGDVSAVSASAVLPAEEADKRTVDPFRERIEREALAASFLYSGAMRAAGR